jgi:hypothetical protein
MVYIKITSNDDILYMNVLEINKRHIWLEFTQYALWIQAIVLLTQT